MNQRQRELRHAAAEAFIESLNQLHDTLQTPAVEPLHPPEAEPPAPSPSTQSFDLDSFEQAVADIEEFIEQRQAKQP